MKFRICSHLYVRNRDDYRAVLHVWHCIVNGGWDSETAIPWAVEKFEADEVVVRKNWRAMADHWKDYNSQVPLRYPLVAAFGV